ncbi:hypothetical protein TP2_13380 [Thioclava pacifica DSM 10166]|uniref:Uncharacterized protein n=1 Tax=Thioclava pacifica DSM 10166 TaxID=1353537 RepID=A0A074J2Y3_9RHOB|nr:hypothetical protein TP2_13380 [Thioclava pacifica DSM 10166]
MISDKVGPNFAKGLKDLPLFSDLPAHPAHHD